MNDDIKLNMQNQDGSYYDFDQAVDEIAIFTVGMVAFMLLICAIIVYPIVQRQCIEEHKNQKPEFSISKGCTIEENGQRVVSHFKK